ncbi:MAG: methyl-accepting chemotaxis protein, partial [Pseudomonas sp.]|uniref:methyl-accepting chemotaxis protein n=1 Tax=Pseudomonas sp. TaxID=306 RepID=UPI00299DCE53
MDNNVLRFNIGSKLIMAFALLILGFGGLLFFTLERFVSLQQSEELQFKQNYERLSAAKELRINIAAQRSDLLLAIDEGTPEELDVREEEIRRHSEENDLQVKRLQVAASDDPEVGDILEQLLAVRSLAAKTREQQLQLIRSGQLEQARDLSSGIQQERIDRIHELGLQLARLTDRRIAEGLANSHQSLQDLRERILNMSLLLVVASVVLTWLLSRHIALPLARLTGWAERIGRGEIPREVIASTRQDEVGRLGQAFGAMSQYLRELVQEMNEGISVLASSSEEILAATSQVAASTQETATAISEIATTVEEVKQTAVLAGSKSQAVAESTERTRQVALGGRQAVEEALAGMQQIREQMQAVAESIMRLGEQSQAIGEIVASVGDLAEQSNLLG